MKKYLFLLFLIFSFDLFAQTYSIPEPKRPKEIDVEKAKAAAEKDETSETESEFKNTIKYGLPSEINELLDDLLKNEDPRFTNEIYDLFQVSKNPQIKEKVLRYFTKLEDPCLENYAVEILIDPYDTKNEIVKAVFQYVSKVKTVEAIEPVVELIKSENEDYFNDAISTIGEIGSEKEAVFLVEFLDRDDLSDAQRQTLMRTCGKMHAIETWDKIVEILENEDENSFVRSYAAEAIGLMKKEESVPILVEHFASTDPNLRQYVIKGLINFPDIVEAKATLLQGIRDEHWKVRQESIRAVKELKLQEAVPYLTYRVEKESEKVIQNESYSAIAALNSSEGNEFLINQITNKKVSDAKKQKVVEVLLKEGFAGEKEILELAKEVVEDDRRKSLRYAIGKELAKNPKDSYQEICLMYLNSKDSTTQNLGLDMYKNKKFAAAEPKMQEIAKDKKANSTVKSRIKKMLNIEDEPEEKK
ncbi:MAG: HEAT repeat domain-containing protein [Treponema sp.]|nr:HEAT repeat domain-containing protein [Treponema sp.]